MDQTIVTQFGTFIDQSDAAVRFRNKSTADRRDCIMLNDTNDELHELYGEPAKPHVNCTQIVGNDIAAATQANKQATQAIQTPP